MEAEQTATIELGLDQILDRDDFQEAVTVGNYLLDENKTRRITRSDGTWADFRRLTQADREALPGRPMIERAVGIALELDALFSPHSERLYYPRTHQGDWEPEHSVSPETLSLSGLSKHERQTKIGDLVSEFETIHRAFGLDDYGPESDLEDVENIGGAATVLNDHLREDTKLSVELQSIEGDPSTILRLVGFTYRTSVEPVSGKHYVRPTVRIETRHGNKGLAPEDYCVTDFVIKQEA